MSTDIASLTLEIDSSSAIEAKENQDALTKSGKELEEQYSKTAKVVKDEATPASEAVVRSFISQRAAVGLLLGTTAALALGAAALAAAFFKGRAEVNEMNSALQVTSGYAGLTRGAMLDLAYQMDATGSVTVASARSIVSALVLSGQIGSQAIGVVARLASDYAAATGKDVDKIAPELAKLFADPAKGAEELNKQMHFLSPAQIAHISHLERIGRLGEAQMELAQRLAAHIPNEVSQLGLLETAWLNVRKAASSAWDAMLGVGRPQTVDEKLAGAQTLEARIRAAMPPEGSGVPQAERLRRQLQAQLPQAQQVVGTATADLFSTETATAHNAAVADANVASNKAANLVKQHSEMVKIRNLQDDITNIQRNAPNGEEKEQAIFNLKKQIRDITNNIGSEERALMEARLGGELKAFETEQKAAAARADSMVKLGIMTAQQGDERKLSLELETLAMKKSNAEQLMAQQGLSTLERLRQAEAIKGFEAESRARQAAFEDAKRIRAALASDLQSKSDATSSQSSTIGQLGDLQQLDSEIEKLKERAKYIGASRDEVERLRAAETERAIALLQYEIVTSESPEDSPYVRRLQAQIDKLRELRNLEAQSAKVEMGADIAKNSKSMEMEVEGENYEARREALEAFLETDAAIHMNHDQLREDLYRQHMDRMNAIASSRRAAEVQGTLGFLNNLSGLMNTNSRKAFEIGKAAAIGSAAVKGTLAVMDAWEAGMSTGGPWAPFIAAAYAAAAGIQAVNMISNISSQQYGGGGGIAGVSGGGIPSAIGQGQSGVAAPTAEPPAAPKGQTTIYNLYGTTYTRAQVRELLEMQNENAVDGMRAVVVEHPA
jgi:hypothetical protein